MAGLSTNTISSYRDMFTLLVIFFEVVAGIPPERLMLKDYNQENIENFLGCHLWCVCCIGCGECVLKCPTAAWTRGGQYFRVVIMGRTGKKNPRLAAGFLQWAEREVVLKICGNLYNYIDQHIDRSLPKEHAGYIVDRTGYNVFKEEVLKDVTLGPKTKVANFLDFTGYTYDKT